MSHVLLWRHADAEPGNPGGDLARALTDRGRRQAAEGAAWIRALADAHHWSLEVRASPAVRTQQTAAALGAKVAIEPAIATDADNTGYLVLAAQPRGKHAALVLVGHQPSIGAAAACLLTGVPHDIGVRKGVIWWFVLRPEEIGDAAATLRGVWSPD